MIKFCFDFEIQKNIDTQLSEDGHMTLIHWCYLDKLLI